MQHEIEKRSHLKTDAEYKTVKSYLNTHAEFIEQKELTTYLFREPKYLRIRITKGKDDAVLAYKIGDYSDPSRKEIEVKIAIHELSSLFELFNELGFKRCAKIKAVRYSYKYKNLQADLSTYDYLGHVIEFEGLTDDESKIPSINGDISQAFKDANLKEIKAKDYQAMMDNMYKKGEQEAIYKE